MKKSILCKVVASAVLMTMLVPTGMITYHGNLTKIATAATTYVTWNQNTVYDNGDVVEYNGKLWKAKWYTIGDVPGTTGQWGVWQEYGIASGNVTVVPTQVEGTGYSTWNASTIYNTGDIVSYGGKNWIAGWYTMGQTPGTTGQWGVWKEYTSGTLPTVTPRPTATPIVTKTPTIAPTITVKPTIAPTVTVKPTQIPVATPTPATTTYQKMIANSLISTGNNYRIKKAIEKAQNGEEVTIACIGGSITEGASATVNTKCYAYQTYLLFKEKYGKNGGSNIHFVNAGMSGTPSSLGVIRYERDVLKKAATKPDIVIVEFAVNDNDDVTNGDAYESLVRNILKADNNPAVILLFSVFQSQWNLQDRFIPIGQLYDLPMVSIKNAVVPEINSHRMTNAQFFASDGWHPLDYGHKIMADCVMNVIDQISYEAKDSSDITIPSTAKIGKSYEGIQMIDSASNISGVTVSAGGFSSKDTNTGTFLYNNNAKFTNTWKHASNGSSTSFTMNLTCKNLMFVYKLSSSYTTGQVDIYVDGSLVKSVNGYSSSGWNNPQTIVLFNKTTASAHKVEIKMSNGNNGKEFTILGFGFTK